MPLVIARGFRWQGCRNYMPERAMPVKRNEMTTNQSPQDIERLLAEADELIQAIDSDILDEMEEEQRLQFEMHAQKLKRIKSEVRSGSDKKTSWEAEISDEEIHEAIADIARAINELTKSIF